MNIGQHLHLCNLDEIKHELWKDAVRIESLGRRLQDDVWS